MNDAHDTNVELFREQADGQEAIVTLPSPVVIDTFMHLSRVLLGADALALTLPTWLGTVYYKTLCAGADKAACDPSFQPRYTRADIEETLKAFEQIVAEGLENLEEAVRERIVASGGAQSVVAKSIIALWYCAALIDLTPPEKGGMGFLTMTAPKEAFGEALAWKTMGANPMGIPGPYYGNWSYPATTLIVAPPRRRGDAGPR